MNRVLLEEKYILEYIRDNLNDFSMNSVKVNDVKYHHNTSYSSAPSIIKHGILSLKELNRLGIRNFSPDLLKIMDDTLSHINGNDGISVSIPGLTDLYHNEDEYNPYSDNLVDFLISSEVSAFRMSHRYGNEFIVKDLIKPSQFRAIDVRLENCIKAFENRQSSRFNEYSLQNLVERYNSLIDIALALKQSNLDIPLREMSNDKRTALDVDKLVKTKKIR